MLSSHLRLGLPSGLFHSGFPTKSTKHSSPHECYKPCPSYPPWLGHTNYTWRRVQVMKILIMQFSLWSSILRNIDTENQCANGSKSFASCVLPVIFSKTYDPIIAKHRFSFSKKKIYCHVTQWIKTGFGLVIGFIDHLQIVTTITYNTSKIPVIITHK
jgi:hypothetical protein